MNSSSANAAPCVNGGGGGSVGGAADAIEAKLHGVEANLRREREAERRKLQIAEEKCRNVQAELTEIQRQIETVHGDFEKLQQETPRQAQLEQQQQMLLHLSKEVRFQHSELVHKREKVEQIRQGMEKGSKHRATTLAQLQAKVQKQRNQKANRQNKLQQQRYPLSSSSSSSSLSRHQDMTLWKDLFASEYKEYEANEVRQKWLQLMALQVRQFQERTKHLERADVAALQRIVCGYRQNFPACFFLGDDDHSKAPSLEDNRTQESNNGHSSAINGTVGKEHNKSVNNTVMGGGTKRPMDATIGAAGKEYSIIMSEGGGGGILPMETRN